MAGALAKALARVNYLKTDPQSIQAVQDYIKQKQQEEDLQNLIKLASQKQGDIRNLYTSTKQDVYEEPDKQFIAPTGQYEETGMTDYVLGDFQGANYTGDYAGARRKASDITSDFMLNSLGSKAPDKYKQVLATLLQGTQQSYEPNITEPESFTLSPGQTRFKGDKPIANVPDREKTQSSNIYERVETFNIGGKPVKKGLRKDTGRWEPLGEAYYDGNGGVKKQDQKWKGVNLSEDYGNVEATISKMRQLHETKSQKFEGDEQTYYDYNGKLYPEKQYAQFKEKEKQTGKRSANQMLQKYDQETGANLSATRNYIRDGIKAGDTLEEAIKKIGDANGYDDDERDLLMKWYIMHNL